MKHIYLALVFSVCVFFLVRRRGQATKKVAKDCQRQAASAMTAKVNIKTAESKVSIYYLSMFETYGRARSHIAHIKRERADKRKIQRIRMQWLLAFWLFYFYFASRFIVPFQKCIPLFKSNSMHQYSHSPSFARIAYRWASFRFHNPRRKYLI